ncbi:hypothetical protein ABZ128_31985 [Streptomyces sp. NPDC006326]
MTAWSGGTAVGALTFDLGEEDGRMTRLWLRVNPEKLRGLSDG